ncbi:MAG: hypothetical protein WC802_03085 [Patescibacteria group bacterium]|jgi:hypothetical protein
MKTSKLLIGASAVAVLLGAGCIPSPKNLIENAVESKINAELGGNGAVEIKDNGITIKDKENGGTTSFGEDMKLPDDFPKDVVIMANAVISGSSTSKDGGWVLYSVSKSPAEVIAWYKDQLTASGWDKYGSTSTTGEETGAFTKGDAWMNVVASAGDDGKTDVTVTRATQTQ